MLYQQHMHHIQSTWFFCIAKIDNIILQDADAFFSLDYKKHLQEKSIHYEKTLVARYLVSLFFLQTHWVKYEIPHWIYNIEDIDDVLQEPQQLQELLWFSYSFTGEYVLLGFATSKIGVDAEIVKSRAESLLLNATTGERYSSWQEFYKSRTAKEAIAKYNNLSLNDVQTIDEKKYAVKQFLYLDESIPDESVPIVVSLFL